METHHYGAMLENRGEVGSIIIECKPDHQHEMSPRWMTETNDSIEDAVKFHEGAI